MPNLTDSEKMEISKRYNEKWNEMKTAAKEKLPENLKEFIVDSIKSSSDRMKSDLMTEHIRFLRIFSKQNVKSFSME